MTRTSLPIQPRILFAVLQTESLANGGVESVTNLICGLSTQPRVVLTNLDTPFTERWRRSGARVHVRRLPYQLGSAFKGTGWRGRLRRLGSLLANNLRVLGWRCRGDFSVIHCNDPMPFWHVALAALVMRVPLLLNLRDTKSQEEGLDIPKYRRRFRLSARVLVLSREMKDFYERALPIRAGRKRAPIDYIYSVVDFGRMRPLPTGERLLLRRQLGIADDTFAVGFIATFNDKKNQLGYISEAAPALRAACPSLQTYFVGDFNPETEPYARSCAEAGRVLQMDGHLHFVGFREDVEKWYQACDVIVIPTRKEGLARCMIEALACGTPVVSFAVSSAREILEEHQCGRVVAQGDYKELCRSLAELARDPELRKKYGANGAAAARRLFGAETALDKYRDLILQLNGVQNALLTSP